MIALAFTATIATPAQANCGHHCRVHKACSNHNPKACVENAVIHGTKWMAPHHRAWMRRVPACESGYDPWARNPSGSSGLYQFMPATWRTTPYRHRSIWSAKWQSLAASWMLKNHRESEWVCR